MCESNSRYRTDREIITDNVVVSESGCWEWQKGLNAYGYGQVQYNGKTVRAHRLSYELFVGEIPEGMMVCHTCDRPICSNPAHLWIGLHADNMLDMAKKKRSTHGIKNSQAILTVGAVKAIRLVYSGGAFTQKKLGDVFGVNQTTVGKIVRREKWLNV